VKLFPGHNLDDLLEDEPAFLIRASDAEGPAVLRKAAFLYRARHGADSYASELEAFAEEMLEWQHADGNAAPPPEADVPAPPAPELSEPVKAKKAPAPSGADPSKATRKERRR